MVDIIEGELASGAGFDLATNQEFWDYINKTAPKTDESNLLNAIRKGVERAVRSFVGCSILQNTYTHYLPRAGERYRGTHGNRILRLPEYPVRSITSIYEDSGARGGTVDGSFDNNSLLTAGDDYWLDEDEPGFSMFGHVERAYSNWPLDPGSVKVVYVAGWSADELAGTASFASLDASVIKLAVLKTVSEEWNEAVQKARSEGAGQISSERLGDWSVSYDTAGSGPGVILPADVKQMLQPFRRLGV